LYLSKENENVRLDELTREISKKYFQVVNKMGEVQSVDVFEHYLTSFRMTWRLNHQNRGQICILMS
jgi:predicted secreted Zn-dependent protease